MKKVVLKAISIVLVIAMLTSMFSCNKKKKSKNKNDSQNVFKVEFALPEGTTEADAALIKLPETEMVSKGTTVNTLTTPYKEGCLFIGWYLDPQLTERLDNTAQINQNLVLYPKFANEDGFMSEMMNNYIATRNVEPAFTFELIADTGSEKELEKYFKITNLSKHEAAVFTAVTDSDPVWHGGDSMKSGEVTAQNDNRLWDFLVKYVGEEELEKDGIKPEDMPAATVSGFKKALGLKEEDNLEEFLLKDLGMDIASALELEELLGMYEEARAISEVLTYRYTISAPIGWDAPDLYQAEILDTEHVRFVYEGQPTSKYVIYYNFTVKKAQIENMKLDSGVKFVKLSDASGVNIDTTMYKLVGDDNGSISSENADGKGTMTYKGTETFQKDDVLAVYDGTFDETTRKVDGKVTYIKITGVSGNGKYDYITAEVPDVVFMPDIIPVFDDGSYGTGAVTLTAAQADFSDPYYKEMGLGADTVIEPGDFLAYYKGNLKDENSLSLVGYALITSVTKQGNDYKIKYKEVSVEQVLSSADLYLEQNNVEIPMSQEDIDDIEKAMRDQAEESGFFTETSNYLSTVITGENYEFENSDNAQVLKNMSFTTDTGEKMTLGAVQLLAAGKRVEVSKPKVQFTIGGKLEYLAADSGVTTGIRGELSATFEITINLNKNTAGVQNQIKITCTAVLEQEIALGITVSCEVKWGWKAIFYVIKDFEIQLALVAGTYSGLGVTVTIQTTTKEEEKEWGDLINASNETFTKKGEETGKKAMLNLKEIGEKCSGIKDKLEKFGGSGKSIDKDKKTESGAHEASQTVGGSFQEKYSGMLDNDCDWCYLIDKELARPSFRPDPFQLVEVSLGINFIVKFKLNCMIGFGVSYENVKQICYTISVNEKKAESSNADLKTPAFRADFYVFGMAGLRIGFKFDARVGLISTKIDSIGVVAELGVFFEVYGFLYIHYSWISGEGESKGIMGSLYFRMGLFLDISFLAQLGDGKLSYSKDLFKIEWPFFEAGAREFPLGYAEKDDLDLAIPKGENSIVIPTEFFEIEMMTLIDGETDNKNCDSEEIGTKGDTWIVDGVPYAQYNEENFIVTVTNHAFVYLPASNTVYVQNPGKALTLETDIIFTYVIKTFGFNTEAIERKVHVKWETDPSIVNVEYYTVEKDGTEQLRDTKQLTAYEGIYYEYKLTEKEVYKYGNYRLYMVEFPDLPNQLIGVENINKKLAEVNTKLEASGLTDTEKESLETEKKQLTAKYTAAQLIVNAYMTNIERVVDGEEYGVITFPFSGENAKVKFYYHQPEHTVKWYIPEELKDGNTRYTVERLGSNKGSFVITYKDKLRDALNEISAKNKEGYEMKWQIVEGKTSIKTGDYLADSKLRNVTSLMPDEDLVVVGIYQPKSYKVTFNVKEKDILTYSVQYNELIANFNPLNPTYTEISTQDIDGITMVTVGIPTISTSAVGTPVMNSVPFSSVNIKEIQSIAASGDASSLVNAATVSKSVSNPFGTAKHTAPQAPEKDGMEFDYWVIDGNEKLTKDTLMPARDILLTPVYKPKTYVVKWVSEDRTVRVDKLEYGEKIVAPVQKNGTGDAATWMLGEQEYMENMTMPAQDITFTAYYGDHVHNWVNPKTVKASTCKEEGELIFECEGCDETKSVIIDIDPSHHVNTETRNAKAATLSQPGYSGDKYCKDCGEKIADGEAVYVPHTVQIGEFSLSFLNDTDYDYYNNTLGYFNHWCDATSAFNCFEELPPPSSPDEPQIEWCTDNEILVMSGDTIVTGTILFDEQDILVKDMTARDYWVTFTPDPEFAGVGSFRFAVPFVD